MKETLVFGTNVIEYTVLYAGRKTLGITVTPEGEVIVKAPHGADGEKIRKMVLKRAPWILKQQSFFLAYFPKQVPKRYISGETHMYLGRQYRLRVVLGEGQSVKLQGQYITVVCAEKDRTKELLEAWYAAHAAVRFHAYCAEWIARFAKYDAVPKKIVIRNMPKRWGSCTAQGKVMLNPELIKAPRGCIEYVIVHELCHLVHFKHNAKFLELQSRMLPTWEVWKNRLEKVMA